MSEKNTKALTDVLKHTHVSDFNTFVKKIKKALMM